MSILVSININYMNINIKLGYTILRTNTLTEQTLGEIIIKQKSKNDPPPHTIPSSRLTVRSHHRRRRASKWPEVIHFQCEPAARAEWCVLGGEGVEES